MENINDIGCELKSNDLEYELLKAYVEAVKDNDFKKLVMRLKISEDVARKYTAKLEMSVQELKNCKGCLSLMECRNRVNGCVFYPRVNGNYLSFDYNACKYMQEHLEKEKYRPLVFEEPIAIRNARMADIDLTDKKRAHVIKWVQKFYKDYQKDEHLKGAYLHGTFGSGKSFILAALINEIAKSGKKCVIIYYPEMLGILKEFFSDDFDLKMKQIKMSDVLLIDDLGAESVTPWSRDEILGTILQYRMDATLPTFITSNLNKEELESHLAQTRNSVDIVKAKRIMERINYLTEDIELNSENRRK